jgi:Metallo-peptidase family M12B Reprolysin-like
VSEGIACHIFVRPVAGTTALFRLFKAYDAYVDVNLIAVAGDSWTSVQWTGFLDGFADATQIFRQVGLRLRQAGQYYIPTASAGAYPTIDNDSEAEDLTDDWTVPVITGTLGGLSPTDGPCDKDAQGMDGVVVEIVAPQNVIIAHEVGHYMGLDHDESPLNLMNAAGSAANTTHRRKVRPSKNTVPRGGTETEKAA